MTDIPKITLKQYIVCNNYRKSLDLYNRSKQKKSRRKTYLQVGDGPRVKSEALIQKQVKSINMFIRGLVKQDSSFSKFQKMMAELLRIFVRQISFLRSSNNTMNSMMKMSCARSQAASNILGVPDQSFNFQMQESKYTKNNCNDNQSPEQSIMHNQSNFFEINIKKCQEKSQSKRLNRLMQRSFLQPPNKNKVSTEIRKQSNSCLFSQEKNEFNGISNDSFVKRRNKPDFMFDLNQVNHLSNSLPKEDYEKSQIERSNVQVFLNNVDTDQHTESQHDFNFLDESLPEQSTMRSDQRSQKPSQQYRPGQPFLTNSVRNSKFGMQSQIKKHDSSSIIKKASLYKYRKIQNEKNKSKQDFIMESLPDSSDIKQKKSKVRFKKDNIENNINYQLATPPCLKYNIVAPSIVAEKSKDLDQSYITESTIRNQGFITSKFDRRSKIGRHLLFQ